MFVPIALLAISMILYFIKTPEFKRSDERNPVLNYGILIILLIMIPIVVRSLIGLSIEFPWKEHQSLYLILILAIALGKVFGGILADKFGLLKVGIGGLIIAAPLLAFLSLFPILGIFGAFIINFTMPVTLITIYNVIPQNKGLAFGLTTVALFIGSLPTITGTDSWLKNDLVVFSFIVIAAMVLFSALIAGKSLHYQKSNQ